MSKVGTTSAPIRLVATIGGFFDGHCEVRWRRGKLWYRHDHVDGSQVSVIPSAAAWERFWASLDQVGIWNWEAHYDDLETCDGEQWSININDGSRSVRSSGSNAYPGGANREHARPFQEFLEAVGALVGQPFGM